MTQQLADVELKAKHRAMWASGDYPGMVETFLLPLGPRLVRASGMGPGQQVLDVGAGTGNASLPAAATGADVTASDLTPGLLDAGRRRAEAEGLDLEWVEADAEHCRSRRLVRRRDVLDRRHVRTAPPAGRRRDGPCVPPRRDDRPAELDARGHAGRPLRAMRPFAPAPPPGAQPPPLWGSEEHLRSLFGDRVRSTRSPEVLEITAFAHPVTTASTSRPTTAPPSPCGQRRERGGASRVRPGVRGFCDEGNRGTSTKARYEMEYLLAVGTRHGAELDHRRDG